MDRVWQIKIFTKKSEKNLNIEFDVEKKKFDGKEDFFLIVSEKRYEYIGSSNA